MAQSDWKKLLQDLRSPDKTNAAIRAAKTISKVANASHVPELYALMDDQRFFVRESAAEPLARLEGARALPVLFQALERGEQDGHDNDGLTFTIIELLEAHKTDVAPQLLSLLTNPEAATRADALWALSYVASEITAQPLFDLLNHDPDPEVRSIAAGSLQSFLDPALGASIPSALNPSPALDTFDGKWFWLDSPPQLQYGVQIKGATGVCLQTNSSTFSIGDTILKIELVSELAFVGQQMFTDGVWRPVTGRLAQDRLEMQGGSQIWQLQKMD